MQSRVRNNPRIKLLVLANNVMVPSIYPPFHELPCSACRFEIRKPRHKKPGGLLEEVYKPPQEFSKFISEVL